MQKDLTILNFNLFGTPFHPHRILRSFFRNNINKRFAAISEEIARHQIDILLFQEVLDYPHLFFLKKQLQQFSFVAYRPMLYGPRGGLVIFSQLPLENVHFYDFVDKGQLHNKSITGYLQQKGILQAKIAGSKVWLATTHLTQNSDHDWSESNRYVPILTSQLTQLERHLQSLKNRKEHIVIGGDFNMPQETSYYHNFMTKTQLQDLFAHDTFTTYHQSFLPHGAKVGRVDYIFTSLLISEKRTSYLFDVPVKKGGETFYVSDHIGLLVTFKAEIC